LIGFLYRLLQSVSFCFRRRYKRNWQIC
jgi:hypothetical protein